MADGDCWKVLSTSLILPWLCSRYNVCRLRCHWKSRNSDNEKDVSCFLFESARKRSFVSFREFVHDPKFDSFDSTQLKSSIHDWNLFRFLSFTGKENATGQKSIVITRSAARATARLPPKHRTTTCSTQQSAASPMESAPKRKHKVRPVCPQ